MSTVYEFTLIFGFPEGAAEPATYLDLLFEAGCDDATAGVGRPGMIALDFARQAVSAEKAVASAVRDVQHALPAAALVEVAPDLVNLTDIAGHLGVTKQNIQKYAAGGKHRGKPAFPPPIFSGPPSLWHLYDALSWFATCTALQPSAELIDTARVACRHNIRIQEARMGTAADG